jgi:hypothetical protein
MTINELFEIINELNKPLSKLDKRAELYITYNGHFCSYKSLDELKDEYNILDINIAFNDFINSNLIDNSRFEGSSTYELSVKDKDNRSHKCIISLCEEFIN